MKKRFIAVLCVFTLMMALPTLAWAQGSVSNNNTANDGNISVVVDGNNVSNVTVSNVVASNAQNLPSNIKILASFEVTGTGGGTVTFNIGSEWAGYTAKVYIQHNDGSEEVQDVVVGSDGSVVVTVSQFSIFTVAVDTDTAPATKAASDKGSTSPQTGLGLGVAGVVAVSAIAAGGVAIALRKKVTE